MGGLGGVAARAAPVVAVIVLLLPGFGLEQLDLARAVATADLPGRLPGWHLIAAGY